MPFDNHNNFNYSTLTNSPGTGGTSFTVQAGDGSKFSTNQNCTICPPNSRALKSNAEIVRITNISSDTLTVKRTQESSTNQNVQAGWQIYGSATAEIYTTIESSINYRYPSLITSGWQSTVGAWIYPDVAGSQAANAPTEYTNNAIDTLKPQYFLFNGSGVLSELDSTNPTYAANGYSTSNWTSVTSHSNHQYITVSGGESDLTALTGSTATTALSTLETFVGTTLSPAPTGIELDIEGYSSWSATDWTNYSSFIQSLGTYLHAHSMKLIVDWQPMGIGVPTGDINPWDVSNLAFNGSFEFILYPNANLNNLATLISGGYLDYVSVDCYDEQFNYGVGTPIAPIQWLQQCVAYAQEYIPSSNLIIGLPSYGYYGTLWTNATTTIASGSNGVSLPQTTIHVASHTGFTSSGTILVQTSNAKLQVVTYSGVGSGTFTGGSGGTGTMSTGGLVYQLLTNYSLTGNVPNGIMNGRTGYATAVRDPNSGEMVFSTWSGSTVTQNWFNDSISMAIKRSVVESMGVKNIHIWSLGGNPWFLW